MKNYFDCNRILYSRSSCSVSSHDQLLQFPTHRIRRTEEIETPSQPPQPSPTLSKMANEAQKKFMAQIDANKSSLITRLAEAVSIPSVSGDAAYRKACFDMADWLLASLNKLGCKNAELKPLGKQTLDGKEIELPPVIFADYGNDSKKKTILVYGVSWYLSPLAL